MIAKYLNSKPKLGVTPGVSANIHKLPLTMSM